MTEPDLAVLLARAAQSIPVPDSDEFATAVADRIRSESVSRAARPASGPGAKGWRPPRRSVAAAIAVLAVVLVLVAATVAPVRSAVADLFGVDGVRITRSAPGPASPPVRPADPLTELHLGQPTTLGQAARRVGFAVRVPTVGAFRQPDAVYVGTPPPGGMASMVYLPRPDRPAVPSGGVAALLSEFRGHLEAGFFQKLAGNGTTVESVKVGGAEGYWLSGAAHEFFYVNADGTVDTETLRLAANTLVWSAGGITYRLESALPRDAAIMVAASMR